MIDIVKKWDSEEVFCYACKDLYFPVPSSVLNLNDMFYFAWVLITLMVMQIKLVETYKIVAIMYTHITFSFNSCTGNYIIIAFISVVWGATSHMKVQSYKIWRK